MMTIHFFVFTIQVKKKTEAPPMPGYRPSELEKMLDRKAASMYNN
ncbi:hypothetical protein [Halobacillus salinarum]|nr:hypothetical protein [Halobacillus salinarum]